MKPWPSSARQFGSTLPPDQASRTPDPVLTGGWSCGSALTLLRRKRRGQPAQPPKRRRLDGSEGKLKASGDLGLGVATEVGQREHLALLLGQAAERAAYLTAPHVAFGQVATILPDETEQAVERN